jgi:hypothetical protein
MASVNFGFEPSDKDEKAMSKKKISRATSLNMDRIEEENIEIQNEEEDEEAPKRMDFGRRRHSSAIEISSLSNKDSNVETTSFPKQRRNSMYILGSRMPKMKKLARKDSSVVIMPALKRQFSNLSAIFITDTKVEKCTFPN